MFFFGDPKATAELLWLDSKSMDGPKIPDVPLDELSKKDLEIAFAYLYRAVFLAMRAEVPEDVMQSLMEIYDNAFTLLANKSEDFVTAIKGNRHIYVTGYSEETVTKYKKLAGIIS
jgi:hypothetical protein